MAEAYELAHEALQLARSLAAQDYGARAADLVEVLELLATVLADESAR